MQMNIPGLCRLLANGACEGLVHAPSNLFDLLFVVFYLLMFARRAAMCDIGRATCEAVLFEASL